jgi:hypothetical protein
MEQTLLDFISERVRLKDCKEGIKRVIFDNKFGIIEWG